MKTMTRIRASLGTVWGTVLYFWPLAVWFVLVAVGLVQVIWAAQVAAGLPVSIAPSDFYWSGVIALIIGALSWVAYWYSHHLALMPGAGLITENRNPYLWGVVSEQAQLAGLPVPKVIESHSSTASANGRSPRHAILAVSPYPPRHTGPSGAWSSPSP